MKLSSNWLCVFIIFSLAFVLNSSGAQLDVLELKAVPDGNYLANLQIGGKAQKLNFEVKNNSIVCVNSADTQYLQLRGKFQPIGNGVFMAFLQGGDYRASQFWVFRKDGSAAIKEIPDRGENQEAVPVSGRELLQK